jgi:hypothetical protein
MKPRETEGKKWSYQVNRWTGIVAILVLVLLLIVFVAG